MSILFWCLSSFFSLSHASAQTKAGTLTVNIIYASEETGQIVVSLFPNEDDMFKKPFRKTLVKTSRSCAVTFTNLPYADYSVQAFLDENSNGILDHSFGIPAEPLSWSNNWRFGLFSGMPTFEKTKITFSEKNYIITINIK
jgi:uncharacterized protein (DUF2141 family)